MSRHRNKIPVFAHNPLGSIRLFRKIIRLCHQCGRGRVCFLLSNCHDIVKEKYKIGPNFPIEKQMTVPLFYPCVGASSYTNTYCNIFKSYRSYTSVFAFKRVIPSVQDLLVLQPVLCFYF